jgi:alanine-synthesizing transaminase
MFSDRTNWRLAQNRFTQALEQVRASGARVLDLTVSNPTRVGLQYDARAILEALSSLRALDYDPQPKGLLSAREAVRDYYRSEHGTGGLDAERIVLTTSTSEGYSFVFRLLCNAGDELLVPKPSYPLFEFLADLQDVRLVPYPLIYDHGWQMDFPSLEEAVKGRTRGVVVVHPNNPTGSYVSEAERGGLNAFCRRHGLALIVDEVFLDYGLEGHRGGTAALGCQVERGSTELLEKSGPQGLKPSSSAALSGTAEAVPFPKRIPEISSSRHPSFANNDEVLTFTLSGLSKISALPQMKAAWVVTSGPAAEAAEAVGRLEIVADTYLSVNAPLQWALPVLLEQRKSIQQQLLARVRTNLAELDRQLEKQKSCQRLQLDGGWNGILRVPVTRSDEDLAIELLRAKSVLVHPGHFYDFASDGYLVVSLIVAEGEFAQGIARVLDYCKMG